MNPRDRFAAVIAGEQPDLVPVIPVLDGYFAPRLTGRKNDECWLDGACMAEALAEGLRRLGCDGVVAEMGLGENPNVLGCPLEVRGHQVPLVVDTLVNGPEDLTKIKVPDPWAEGKMEPVQQLVEAAGDSVVIGSVRSPFEFAATVRGLIGFMTDFYGNPGLVRDLIDACFPATVTLGLALAGSGVDALVIKDSFASSSMISPGHYLEFAFPSEVEAVKELGGRLPVILHVCRNSLPILPDMARTGAAVLEIDSPVDLIKAREAVGSAVVLKGNIDAVGVIEKGSRADVESAVRAALEAAKPGGRFILSTGDSIPSSAPEENVAALVEFGREFGKY